MLAALHTCEYLYRADPKQRCLAVLNITSTGQKCHCMHGWGIKIKEKKICNFFFFLFLIVGWRDSNSRTSPEETMVCHLTGTKFTPKGNTLSCLGAKQCCLVESLSMNVINNYVCIYFLLSKTDWKCI